MDADNPRPDPARTPTPRPETRTSTSASGGVPDAEAFDHLEQHDPSARARSQPVPAATDRMARWRGEDVRWVRACDALAQTSGRATGRGITWTTYANRLPRLAPLRQAGTGRRAIARASATPRASRPAPVSAFGATADSTSSVARRAVSR